MANGQVVGGDFHGATVTTAPIGNALVVQGGFKWRRLVPEQVAEWVEKPADTSPSRVSAIGKAVAGAVAPRMLSKTASAAVGAALDSTVRPPHFVQVDWLDGKQSLLKLPDSLFAHFAIVLRDRRAANVEPARAVAEADAKTPAEPPTMTQQAFLLVSDLVRERLPRQASVTTEAQNISTGPDLADQLKSLAALRDQGILTDEEFAAKKQQLLDRI